jgi:hypothetical protein
MATIAERVARGAALLDEREPGWWQRIDLSKLDIKSCEDCIAAQLGKGDYLDGLHAIGVTCYEDEDGCGFDGAGDEYESLAEEWRLAIEERRGDEPR